MMLRPMILWRTMFLSSLMVASAAAGAQAQIKAGTTIQLPTFGVAVDADGVLSLKSFADPSGRLMARRLAAVKARLADDVMAPSMMRKISLVKLERAIRKKIAAGELPDEVMRHLAGLLRVQYVFFYPEERDIVIAGQAEGWLADLSGRKVGVTTRWPVLLLEDLIVALRAYGPGSPKDQFIGCTISPDRNGLARLSEFQRTIPRTVPTSQRAAAANRIATGSRQSLGQSQISVFGVSNKTHFAQVLIEADYRMKLIGIGLEPPPVKMHTFIGALKGAQHQTLQRWWFTPNYDCVKVTDDRSAMELVGQGVQLLGEDKLIGADGSLAAKGIKPNKASELFTLAFTKKYPDISARIPVYAQMRTMIDLVVAAAFIRQEDFYGRADWSLGLFGNEEALPVETFPEAQNVACAVNVVWKGNRLFVLASGGVSIRPILALREDRLIKDRDGKLAEKYRQTNSKDAGDRWWWD